MSTVIEHHRINLGEVELHVAAAGPKDGEPLLFLHGFPEFWYAWKAQLEYFAAQGYRVYAPDQRGVGESTKPPAVSAYHIDKLAGDALALMDAFGHARFNLVGHDWGGIITWHLLSWHAPRLQRVVVLNAPHLSIWRAAMLRTPSQILKSWYVFAFQLPGFPEKFAGSFGGKTLLRMSGLDKVLDAHERELYADAYAGALKTMINWYRAAMRYAGVAGRAPDADITTPMLMLWGRNDAFLTASLAQDCMRLCSDGELRFIEDASHFLVHERPQEINQAIHQFLAKA